MNKKICLLLVAIIATSIFSQFALGFENPLKKYNLYEDVHKNYKENNENETVMGDMFYSQNGLNKGNNNSNNSNSSSSSRKTPPSANPTSEDGKAFNDNIENVNVEIPKRRNEYLRESSKDIYAPEGSPRWGEGQVFYDNPTLDSIIEKYRKSNFAGCMQECEAYVRLHPDDTLGFYYLAMCYSKADDKDNAVRAYEKVISLNANPMIVKYATNGRNCVLKSQLTEEDDPDSIKCYENVNEPELLYPYKDAAKAIELTPVDPKTLMNKNLEALENKWGAQGQENAAEKTVTDKDGKKVPAKDNNKITLPFANQDSALDEFIKAPYGSGLSPELEKQYKQMQLREFQQNLNNGNDVNKSKTNFLNKNQADKNPNKKSEAETVKLALADNNDLQSVMNSPEFIQNKKEMDQIRMMFGDYNSNTKENDLMEMIPALTQGDEKLSPQAMQMLMMQSVMPDIINIDGSNTF